MEIALGGEAGRACGIRRGLKGRGKEGAVIMLDREVASGWDVGGGSRAEGRRGKEREGGAYSFVACSSHLTIDHALFSRRSKGGGCTGYHAWS